jgi:hypothetical protein
VRTGTDLECSGADGSDSRAKRVVALTTGKALAAQELREESMETVFDISIAVLGVQHTHTDAKLSVVSR